MKNKKTKKKISVLPQLMRKKLIHLISFGKTSERTLN